MPKQGSPDEKGQKDVTRWSITTYGHFWRYLFDSVANNNFAGYGSIVTEPEHQRPDAGDAERASDDAREDETSCSTPEECFNDDMMRRERTSSGFFNKRDFGFWLLVVWRRLIWKPAARDSEKIKIKISVPP